MHERDMLGQHAAVTALAAREFAERVNALDLLIKLKQDIGGMEFGKTRPAWPRVR